MKQRASSYAKAIRTEVSTDLEPKASGPRSSGVEAQLRWRNKHRETYNAKQAALMRRRREKAKQ